MDTIQVALGERSYPIHIGPGLIGDQELLRHSIPATQVLIVTNEVVAPLYLNAFEDALSAKQQHSLVLPDGESEKTLASLAKILDKLVEQGFHRDAYLVALGGGVIGDLTGFAAACYQRGIKFAQIPTTLLAQVDSSVGGKTAVNHPKAKNMIGAFHQPSCVLADTNTLKTLPTREFSAGLAEVIKHGLILDSTFFNWLENNIKEVLTQDSSALTHIVRRSCEIKADIVSKDEFEQGARALLNLGHTFGHALESLVGYGEWLHGEAVSIGINLAAETSRELGMIKTEDCERIRSLLKQAGLPVRDSKIEPDALLKLMRMDKKANTSGIRMVLLEDLGNAVVVSSPDERVIKKIIQTQSIDSSV
ncbi:MAG: 3-dehydroquinate synthase [Gammaproteobacteria bacterium]|nr:3-dehydroquinate synthase [Gammaproteobacteria bacterium]